MANYLQLKWTTSRARDTYGYNIVTLTDSDTGKKYRATGGGYDMTGTVVGEWLAGAADPDDAPATINDRTRNDSGLYGMTTHRSPKMTRTWVTLDGGCGLQSMRTIAEAIGMKVTATIDRKGNATGFIRRGGVTSMAHSAMTRSVSHVTVVKDAHTGRRHEVPDIWIAGYCQGARLRGEPGEIADALNWWLTQAWLAEQEEANGDA
jgi:hypothetical protein